MAYVLQLLGEFRLAREDGAPVSLPDRGRALLAYLAVASSPVPRQLLSELLGTGGDERELRALLRQAVYVARKAIADRNVICAHENGLVLNEALVETDIQRFRNAIARGDEPALREAAALYRGPFLEGLKSPSCAFEEWLAAQRAEILNQVLEALLDLADREAAAGLNSHALAHARQALTLDPLREDAHRRAMRCLAAMNQRSNALRQYEIARKALAAELGVPPEAETEALRAKIASGEEGPKAPAEARVAGRTTRRRATGRAHAPSFFGRQAGWRRATAAFAVAFLVIGGGVAVWYAGIPTRPSGGIPSIAVLPFANVSGDPDQDYLERGVVAVITAMLATHPGIRVVSRVKSLSFDRSFDTPELGRQLGAQYLLEGSVRKSAGEIHMTAQLVDAATGDHLWARQFEEEGHDLVAIQERIANNIYESLVGFTGVIERNEQRRAWERSPASLQEQDFALRGEQFYFQFTKAAHARARQIWQDGLAAFPDSAKLRRHLAASYRHGVEAGWSENPEQDLETAWQLGREGALGAHTSRFEEWTSHWLMAKLAQWCRQDFELSVTEAKAAIDLVPYDATSRADIAELMANAGRSSEAIAWLKDAMRRDPTGPEWYRANLAWAYYLAGRYEDSRIELQRLSKPRHLLLAAVHVELGQDRDARAVMADFLTRNPGYTLADEARRPLTPALRRVWLDDLRRAGLPER